MTDNEAITAIAKRLEKTGNWRARLEYGNLVNTMSNEIVPFSLQIEERRYRDAADYMIAAYGSAKELITIVERRFPEAGKVE